MIGIGQNFWMLAYSKPEPDFRCMVAQNVRELLAIWTDARDYGTPEIVEALFPQREQRGAGIDARARLVRALMSLAKGDLKDCASRGPKQPHAIFKNKTVRPWRWRRPAWEPTREELIATINDLSSATSGTNRHVVDWCSAQVRRDTQW